MVTPAHADGARQSAVLAAARSGGRHRGLPDRRRAGGRGAGVRHADHPARGQDRGARQHLRGAGQAQRLRRRWASTWSPGPARSWWSPTTRPSRTWLAADLLAQAEHDPMARALLITDAPDLAPRVAGAPWRPSWRGCRAGPSPPSRSRPTARSSSWAISTRRSSWPIAWRPSTWSCCVRAPEALLPACGTRAPSSWAVTRQRWSATTWPDPTTCSPRGARRASPRPLAPRTS